jgi:alkaline phosphatase D
MALRVNTMAQSDQTLIAFGSCSDEDRPQELWNDIAGLKPAIWIWGGDNIYADSGDTLELKRRYTKQFNDPGYQKLLATCPITGTWDDHDYGTNDGGKYWSHKDECKVQALRFLQIPKSNPVWNHSGIYNSTEVGKGKNKIKIINLDTRYFRDTIVKVFYKPTGTEKKEYKYEVNPTGDVLGEAQWKWLEEELKKSDAALNIINSSIQVISEEHRFEKWGNLPVARERLLKVIAQSGKKIIIISGDRHIAEFSKMNLQGYKYPLYDFTSSGLTHTWPEKWEEANRYRVGELIIQKNFGLIFVHFGKNKLDIQFEVRGKNGQVFSKENFSFAD